MEIEGKVILDLGVQEGISKAGNPWKKQEWVMETMGNYPRKVKFTVFGEARMDQLRLTVGENYRISVDVESREYQGRWYTDVNAYAAMPLDGRMPSTGTVPPAAGQTQQFGGQQAPAAQAAVDPFAGGDDNTDDLPF